RNAAGRAGRGNRAAPRRIEPRGSARVRPLSRAPGVAEILALEISDLPDAAQSPESPDAAGVTRADVFSQRQFPAGGRRPDGPRLSRHRAGALAGVPDQWSVPALSRG